MKKLLVVGLLLATSAVAAEKELADFWQYHLEETRKDCLDPVVLDSEFWDHFCKEYFSDEELKALGKLAPD